mmetsp:Transcript_4835/g.9460  ORF Transcript_4835/g.9460 Transcript_4835/m.9460 type:complete len:103 (-) Transcript_4835:47-355(-)
MIAEHAASGSNSLEEPPFVGEVFLQAEDDDVTSGAGGGCSGRGRGYLLKRSVTELLGLLEDEFMPPATRRRQMIDEVLQLLDTSAVTSPPAGDDNDCDDTGP